VVPRFVGCIGTDALEPIALGLHVAHRRKFAINPVNGSRGTTAGLHAVSVLDAFCLESEEKVAVATELDGAAESVVVDLVDCASDKRSNNDVDCCCAINCAIADEPFRLIAVGGGRFDKISSM
jgi:hypothetical protein